MATTDQSLSVLCVDVAGRVRLPRYVDRADALYAVERCERRIRRSVESHGGRLVNRADAKMMAYFTDSVAALQSAIELQQRISDLPPYAGAPLAARVGICTGHQSKEEQYFSREGANPAASLQTCRERLITSPGRCSSTWLAKMTSAC